MTIDLEILCDNFAIYYNTYLWIKIQEEFSLGICSIYGVLSGIGFIILVKDINFYALYKYRLIKFKPTTI